VKIRSAVVFASFAIAGCTPPPTVTNGTFNDSYTLTMQRGTTDVVVKTSGPASYRVTNYRMDHPMGKRPDTEATITTPAGTFRISDRNVAEDGVMINGTLYKYPERTEVNGRSTIVIDERGGISIHPPQPEAPRPQED
jgi:hypothetical protein